MKRLCQLSILGILILFGVGQTGCGVLRRQTSADSLAPDSAKAMKTTESHTSTPELEKPILQYPSFGLDTTGSKVLALNERLAELGYLPLMIDNAAEPSISLANLNHPPQVSFQWRFDNIPSELAAEWSANSYTQMTRAAVIAVEHVNGLAIDGIVGEAVWKAILNPNAIKNPNPYTFVLVTETPAPEKLSIWQEGKWVYQSIANTGEPGAPSTIGTFAVFKRFASQTMKGENPDGTKYVDPGVPYVNYYHGSEAIHGFERASYGFPQSVGCVELPINHSKIVWSLINYGTLVTVEGQYNAPKAAGIATKDTNHNADQSTNQNTDQSAGLNTEQSVKQNTDQSNKQSTSLNAGRGKAQDSGKNVDTE